MNPTSRIARACDDAGMPRHRTKEEHLEAEHLAACDGYFGRARVKGASCHSAVVVMKAVMATLLVHASKSASCHSAVVVMKAPEDGQGDDRALVSDARGTGC